MRCAVRGLATSATTQDEVGAQLRDLLRVAIATAERLEPQAVRQVSSAGSRRSSSLAYADSSCWRS